MTDLPPPHLNNTLTSVVALLALAFNAGLLVYCVVWGSSSNSLHQSALSWSFVFSGLIFAGFGIGSITPDILSAFTKRQT